MRESSPTWRALCALSCGPNAKKAKARAHSWKESPGLLHTRAHEGAFALPLCPQNAALSSGLRAGCMGASEKTYRLYSCGRCAKQVRICGDCDRGNRYCAGECTRIRRRESLRRAAERYQLSYRGACRHAARQRAWRACHAQKVTHQGSIPTAVTFIVGPNSTRTATEGTHADIASVQTQPHATPLELAARRAHGSVRRLALSEPRCCFCGHTLARFARLGSLRAGP